MKTLITLSLCAALIGCALPEKKLHPDFYTWDERIQWMVKDSRIGNGMTQEQVIESWGRPVRVFDNSFGEVWQYSGIFYGTRAAYLYFDRNDVLTHWSN